MYPSNSSVSLPSHPNPIEIPHHTNNPSTSLHKDNNRETRPTVHKDTCSPKYSISPKSRSHPSPNPNFSTTKTCLPTHQSPFHPARNELAPIQDE
ncbi:hypothetical protein EYC84_007012 [Monilinia fructicola]|uniref:Uncharacterized protein n=1 Tax=Monilinia fructicola TaxID=38448 RepID=A0A5M9K7X6_MONFR|nr:hypothetical protein EYC84_007012 [Monilinia fructicola]